MYKVQHGIDADIMNGIFRKRNMAYNTKNSSGIEKRIQKDSENISKFKSDIKLWKSDSRPCHCCKLYLP